MNGRFLEVTYRKGRPIAAYLYLPRKPDDRCARSKCFDPGLVMDFAEDGRVIGIEITSPTKTTLADLNRALTAVSQPELEPKDAAPLLNAA
jgi:hypothetical protein